MSQRLRPSASAVRGLAVHELVLPAGSGHGPLPIGSFRLRRGWLKALPGCSANQSRLLRRVLSGQQRPLAGRVLIRKCPAHSLSEPLRRELFPQSPERLPVDVEPWRADPDAPDPRALIDALEVLGLSDCGDCPAALERTTVCQARALAWALARWWSRPSGSPAVFVIDQPAAGTPLRMRRCLIETTARIAELGAMVCATGSDPQWFEALESLRS